MRTTVRLEDELLRGLKEYAARHNRTLTSLLEEAVRLYLLQNEPGPRGERVSLPTSTAGGGTRSGVDLDDTAALLDLLDERAAT